MSHDEGDRRSPRPCAKGFGAQGDDTIIRAVGGEKIGTLIAA